MRKIISKNPFSFLKRSDKWYLGGGNRLQWAPEFPKFLDRPGFWDHAAYYNIPVQHLFTWVLVDRDGNELAAKFVRREWTPAELRQHFLVLHEGTMFSVVESKSILPNDVALCTVRITITKGRPVRGLSLVAWTSVESNPSGPQRVKDVQVRGNRISFVRTIKHDKRPEMPIACAFGLSTVPRSVSVMMSESGARVPNWNLSPFSEQVQRGKLQKAPVQVVGDGHMFAALQAGVSDGKTTEIALGLALAPSVPEAINSLGLVLKQRKPEDLSPLSWNDYAASVPAFECSDAYLTNYYWYRWYGLRLNTMYGGEGNYRHPFVCEGIGYFRAAISFSASCHVLENRWLHEPELARGSMNVFFDTQRPSGAMRGYIDVNHDRPEMFYHTNWGNALTQLDRIHPSPGFLEKAYSTLARYAEWMDGERDSEGSGLYDILNHYETGQEYMSRYLAVNEGADREHWGHVFRLKGVDVTVYMYELKRALRIAAEKLGKSREAAKWESEAGVIRNAVLKRMWDPKTEMFFDVNPATGRTTGVKSAVNFYPYTTDIPEQVHVQGLKSHLFNPREFWPAFPVPSSSMDDPLFSPEPVWKEKRMNCPWNGRVWPMTNSHLVEALASSAIRFNDTTLRQRCAELMTKFVRMMFFDGDPSRPNCFEHYNPLTGHPSSYRGIDDYQHSWVNDLIIKYVCGIRPDDMTVTIDPFPFGLRSATIRNVHVRGRMLDVRIRGNRFRVGIDGSHHAESRLGTPITLQI